MTPTVQKTNLGITNATASLIVSVVAWLWAVPVIDSLDSYSYGMATRALITSFIPFVIGVVVAVKFPNYTTQRRSIWALIIASILLTVGLVFYSQIHFRLGWWLMRHFPLLRIIGFAFLGYGLETSRKGKQCTFKKGLIILIGLYVIYNLVLWGTHNPHPDYMFLYNLANIIYALVRICVVVTLWKTLSADSVKSFLSKFPKTSLLIAGLFWGMILVLPANRYSPRWLAILMLFFAPFLAYIYSVLVRFSFKLVSLLFKNIISNRGWWKEACVWWN